MPESSQPPTPLTRRDFLLTSAAAAALASGCASGERGGLLARGPRPDENLAVPPEAAAQPLRVAVIGCGGRGTGAAINAVDAAPNVKIVALADLFADRLASCRERLTADRPDHCDLADERCFTGFDAFQKVCDLPDVHLVILATPPHFRPQHLEAAVAAGKHVFMEKPVAVDPPGVRRVIAASEQAAGKQLAIVAGTQRRHDPAYEEIMRRIHDGAIGEIVAAQCYWNMGALWVHERKPEYSDMEWQCRNWLYFTWLSGDHIVEQHVHNLDVINWALGGPPVKCVGMGGRQARTGPQFGNIFDHFAVEYEYPGGVRVLSMCRQTKGASERVSERIVGTRGWANPAGEIGGRRAFKFEYPDGVEPVNPYVNEHRRLIASIRTRQPLNEGRQVAESTLTAIMGRMSAYTGRELSWDWVMNASQLDLSPPQYTFGPVPEQVVAVPGQTPLI